MLSDGYASSVRSKDPASIYAHSCLEQIVAFLPLVSRQWKGHMKWLFVHYTHSSSFTYLCLLFFVSLISIVFTGSSHHPPSLTRPSSPFTNKGTASSAGSPHPPNTRHPLSSHPSPPSSAVIHTRILPQLGVTSHSTMTVCHSSLTMPST